MKAQAIVLLAMTALGLTHTGTVHAPKRVNWYDHDKEIIVYNGSSEMVADLVKYDGAFYDYSRSDVTLSKPVSPEKYNNGIYKLEEMK